MCGGAAACIASFITHPADVIKTYMQLHPSEFARLTDGLIFIYRVGELRLKRNFSMRLD